MYPTASKGTKQDALVVSAIMLFAVGPHLPGFVSMILREDYSQMGIVELPVTILLILFATIALLFGYYITFTALIYISGKCTITGTGINVHFCFPFVKDRFFAWDNIEKVVFAGDYGWKDGLELRCFTADFQKNAGKWFRRFQPESKIWSDLSVIAMQSKWAVTIQYSPELLEAVRQYHPDIIYYPSKKEVEGLIELRNKSRGD